MGLELPPGLAVAPKDLDYQCRMAAWDLQAIMEASDHQGNMKDLDHLAKMEVLNHQDIM